jgi:hypothetical protein
MKLPSKFFLAVLLLTVASTSWAACPEDTKKLDKGCEPTKNSLKDVTEVLLELRDLGPERTKNSVGNEASEEEIRKEIQRQDEVIFEEDLRINLLWEMCPDSTRQTLEGCKLDVDVLNEATEEIYELWLDEARNTGEINELFLIPKEELVQRNVAIREAVERLRQRARSSLPEVSDDALLNQAAEVNSAMAEDVPNDTLSYKSGSSSDCPLGTKQTYKGCEGDGSAVTEATEATLKALELSQSANTVDEKIAAKAAIEKAAEELVAMRTAIATEEEKRQAALKARQEVDAAKILADYEAEVEARAAEKEEILENAVMTETEEIAAEEAATSQAEHSKLADDATPSRWDSLTEEEQAESLTSSEGAKPSGHEASEEETAKANESHVYDEDGIRVFDPPAPPTPPIEE